jgi:hypothetical protein
MSCTYKTRIYAGAMILLASMPCFGQATGVGSETSSATAPATASQPPAGTATMTNPQTENEPVNGDEMQTIIVTGIPPEENILPTSRPTSSIYGFDLPVLDTPRSATIISREQLSQIDIQDARDYDKLTSDSYTESDFGTPAVPSIRGQPGDVLINGMRTAANADGNGPPVDFNNIESVNIIKGPPDATTGSSQFVGGYVDEITKKPYFDKFQGDASTTIGMYDQFRQTLDFGGPIVKDQLAYRVSYSGTESGSYYELVHNDSQTGYLAMTWIPSDKYTLDFNASFGEVDYLENNGINRVTQNLIDNGEYATGQALPVGGGFFNPIPVTGNVNISRSDNTHNPNDGAYAETANTQAIQTFAIDDDQKIVSNTFWQYLYWRTLNGQGYDQLTNGDNTVDQRISYIWGADIPITDATKATSDPKDEKAITAPTESEPGLTFHNTVNTGAEFRMESHDDYQSFAAEPFNAYDLTANDNDIFVPPSVSATGFPTPYKIPGMPGQYIFQPANSGASEVYETSGFVQDKFDFTKEWSLIFGGRADIFYVDAKNPVGSPTGNGDPNIFAPDHTTQVLSDFNVSPTYKPFPWMTVYATLNRGQAPGNTTQSGAFSPSDLASSQFHEWATMYEFGAKFSLIKDKLFTTITGYDEHRYEPATTGGSYKQRVEGVETDLAYQPDKHFYATLSYSYAYGVDIDPGFLHETNSSYTVGGTTLTDQANFDLLGTFKSPGFPNHVINALFVYKFDNGFGVSADAQATSPILVTWGSNVEIPWQYNVDFSAFYTWKESEVKLSVYNATDQQNWGSVNPIYGLDSIFAAEPIHLEGTLKIHF